MKTYILAIVIITLSFNGLVSCAQDGMSKAKAARYSQVMSI